MNTDNLLAKALKLSDTIDYQKDSVVSKTVINKPSGSITLFAFDTEQGLSEHTSPFNAFVFIMDGETEITISGKSIQVKQGEFIIMPANQPHALKADKPFKMMLVMIK